MPLKLYSTLIVVNDEWKEHWYGIFKLIFVPAFVCLFLTFPYRSCTIYIIGEN